MSDFILKIFPEAVSVPDHTAGIRAGLVRAGFLSGAETEFYGETYLMPGPNFCDFFSFEDEAAARVTYQSEARIRVLKSGYGVILQPDSEEPEFADRNNLIEIWNIDGNYTGWTKLCNLLQALTGEAYIGNWEIL